MKLAAPYRCDYCERPKEASNHWWLHPISKFFVLEPWDSKLADEPTMEHICSEQCAVKALSKWMATTPQRSADPQADEWKKAEGA
jgi:hypothetical protein